jgi:hypothetical protein
VLRIGRRHGAEHLRLLVLRVAGASADRRVHGGQGQHLQQVVLDHVAQRANGIVERAAALDTEIFGHRDLHAGHALAVPQVGQRHVGEPQVLEAGKPDSRPRRRRDRAWRLPPARPQRLPPAWRRLIK